MRECTKADADAHQDDGQDDGKQLEEKSEHPGENHRAGVLPAQHRSISDQHHVVGKQSAKRMEVLQFCSDLNEAGHRSG